MKNNSMAFVPICVLSMSFMAGCAMNSGPSEKEMKSEYSTLSCSELHDQLEIARSQVPAAEMEHVKRQTNYEGDKTWSENNPMLMMYVLMQKRHANEAEEKVDQLNRKLMVLKHIHAEKCSD